MEKFMQHQSLWTVKMVQRFLIQKQAEKSPNKHHTQKKYKSVAKLIIIQDSSTV